MANIVITGPKLPLQEELSRLLREEGHDVATGSIRSLGPVDVVFCSGEDASACPALLRKIHAARPDLPVVVVTRSAETDKWLDALDAGAANYCSPPFEPQQIRWLLASVMERATALTKVRTEGLRAMAAGTPVVHQELV